MEARYEVWPLNVKLTKVQLLRLPGKTFHTLPLFYLRTKILRTYARKNYVAVEIRPDSKETKDRLHFLPIYKLQIRMGHL